jgi:hypothetical protein
VDFEKDSIRELHHVARAQVLSFEDLKDRVGSSFFLGLEKWLLIRASSLAFHVGPSISMKHIPVKDYDLT